METRPGQMAFGEFPPFWWLGGENFQGWPGRASGPETAGKQRGWPRMALVGREGSIRGIVSLHWGGPLFPGIGRGNNGDGKRPGWGPTSWVGMEMDGQPSRRSKGRTTGPTYCGSGGADSRLFSGPERPGVFRRGPNGARQAFAQNRLGPAGNPLWFYHQGINGTGFCAPRFESLERGLPMAGDPVPCGAGGDPSWRGRSVGMPCRAAAGKGPCPGVRGFLSLSESTGPSTIQYGVWRRVPPQQTCRILLEGAQGPYGPNGKRRGITRKVWSGPIPAWRESK